MTIRFKAHVQSLALSAGSKVAVTLNCESARSEPITIHAEPGEVSVYKPGTEVEVAVTPTGRT